MEQNAITAQLQVPWLHHARASIAAAVWLVVQEAITLLRLDLVSVLIGGSMLLMFVPTINRHADNAALLQAFIEDEPLITMQLDGMTTWPWGDPSNYLRTAETGKAVPAHWLNLRYDGIVYYGGLFLDLAFLIWVPLKLFGLPLFPTAPIVLRALALTFSVFTLLSIYNFGRRYFGLVAALLGSLFLLTSFYFFMIGTIIHPDSLLFFLSILGLVVCIRHAREGTMDSLLGIGIVAGLAQGAKMGGPLLVPVAILSIVLGLRKDSANYSRMLSMVMRQGFTVLAVAIAVFIVTTPYVILNSYFFHTWKAMAGLFRKDSPIGLVTAGDWLSGVASSVGYPLLIASGIAVAIHLINRSGRYNSPAKPPALPERIEGVVQLRE